MLQRTLSFLWTLVLAGRTCHAFIQTHHAPQSTALSYTAEDIFAAIHRKEYEMKKIKAQHTKPSDPVRMALEYGSESVGKMRLAGAVRRITDEDAGGMRRASFVADIKRKSPRSQRPYCNFDSAAPVAAAMVQLGADAVFINTDYTAYGGDWQDLKSAVKAVRKVSQTAAVVCKDIVVDEIQMGLAKDAGADAIVLCSTVLGASLDSFLDQATFMGLECIVECHTRAEVERALDVTLAPTILVNNYDRMRQEFHPEQARQLAGLFPGSGGPIITLATGGLKTSQDIKKVLSAGYDGVVVGEAIMGSTSAPELIRTVKDRTLLPAELSQWGENVDFDKDGNIILDRNPNAPSEDDPTAYQ